MGKGEYAGEHDLLLFTQCFLLPETNRMNLDIRITESLSNNLTFQDKSKILSLNWYR